MKKVIKSELVAEAVGPYSQAIQAKDTLYISGQLPIDKQTGLMADNIKDQAIQSMNNIKFIIEEAGYQMEDIVKTTVLLTDLNNFNIVNEVYGQYFKANYPARACYQIVVLPKKAMIEIEAIAVKN